MKILLVLALGGTALGYYSNKQANSCFEQKGVAACSDIIKQCTDNSECLSQLSKYQQCSFGDVDEHIFNGHCFREWKQQAKLTSALINCLTKQCNLLYNSAIGTKQLFDCSQQTIVNNYRDCNQQCAGELNKIRDHFNTMEVDKLFDIEIHDQAAKDIIELIKKNCISQAGQPHEPAIQQQQFNPNKQQGQQVVFEKEDTLQPDHQQEQKKSGSQTIEQL